MGHLFCIARSVHIDISESRVPVATSAGEALKVYTPFTSYDATPWRQIASS